MNSIGQQRRRPFCQQDLARQSLTGASGKDHEQTWRACGSLRNKIGPPTEAAILAYCFGGLALVLVSDFIVVISKIVHQDIGVSVFHWHHDRPHLKGAISPIFCVGAEERKAPAV